MARTSEQAMIRRSRVLTVEPTGGLANRLRVVDSAATLAEQWGLALTVFWTRNPDLHARFDQLFEPLPGVCVCENSWTMSRLWRSALRMLRCYRPYLDQAAVEARFASGVGFDDIGAGRRPFVITCSRLAATPTPLRRFVPVASLRREIEELTRSFGPSTVGVHVRHHHHAPGRRSPTEKFVAWMQAELGRNPDTRFFLAADSLAEENDLKQAFPGRVVTRPKSFARDRPEGIRDAVVDLYGLARTSRIAGTYYSSFSEAASEIGGIELTVIDVGEGPSSTR